MERRRRVKISKSSVENDQMKRILLTVTGRLSSFPLCSRWQRPMSDETELLPKQQLRLDFRNNGLDCSHSYMLDSELSHLYLGVSKVTYNVDIGKSNLPSPGPSRNAKTSSEWPNLNSGILVVLGPELYYSSERSKFLLAKDESASSTSRIVAAN
ncbi:hypothetical protein CLF_104380 [Clonorchis sinensis]|uniref:Uncharacterized protein n=1 Tax=Clonorchis sinensis TaxID=79923 RepID=G7YBJ5_CLOSI|nr:hypothetical protein CLF_104380 [Clonorchis sinensis]